MGKFELYDQVKVLTELCFISSRYQKFYSQNVLERV